MSVNPEFGKMRTFLWPIKSFEVKKFLPLLIIYALICFNYTLLKAAKDTLIITAPGSGAEAIPFIKVWVILPMALLVMVIFTRLFNRYSQEKLFYIMISSFLAFFALFALVLYPLNHIIHPNDLADTLQAYLPAGFRGLLALFRNWSYVLFYVAAELWGTAIMSVLFWSFANEITTVKDAKRFYGILGVGANIATIFSGHIAIVLSGEMFDLSFIFGDDRWGQSLGLLTTVVIGAGLVTIAIFRWYHVQVLNKDPSLKKMHTQNNAFRKSVKMGIRKNFSFLKKSKYLLCIAVLVIAFNIAINMMEIIWKDQVKLLYPNPNHFNAYMGKVLRATGVLSTFIGFFLCGNMIRRLGWTLSALITPIIILITGSLFFGMLLLKDNELLSGYTTMIGLTPLSLGVLFGTLQNTITRSSKYTLFDATKEIAFIPLSPESKLKGKAAIDGIGSRIGKSGGSFVYQALFMIFGTITMSTPFVGIFLSLVIFGWIAAVKSLGKQFHHLTTQNEKLDISLETPAPNSDILAAGKVTLQSKPL